MLSNGTFFRDKSNNIFYYGDNTHGQSCAGVDIIGKIDVGVDVKDVVTSQNEIFVLYNDGTVKGCGTNNSGQLGLGDTTIRNVLVTIPITNVKKIACGERHTLFLLNDGTVKGCGVNTAGQLGNGNLISPQLNIINVSITDVDDIVCGGDCSFFITRARTLKACGANGYGQLMTKNTTVYNTPIQVISSGVEQVSASGYHTLVKASGIIYSAGRNDLGQLGRGNSTTTTSVEQLSISDVSSITANSNSSFFVLNDGTVKVCGYNIYGILGLGHTTSPQLPVTQCLVQNVKQVVCTTYTTFFILNDGNVKSCGRNYIFSAGIDAMPDITTPTNVNISNIINAYANSDSILFFKNNCDVYGLGYNTNNKLLLYNVRTPLFKKKVTFPKSVKQIVTANSHTLVLYYDGTVMGCGANDNGQLGLQGYYYNTLTELPISNVKYICVYDSCSFFILNDGTVRACGSNHHGQLGIGNTVHPQKNIITVPISNVKKISGGSAFTVFLLNDGTVSACGYNYYGQMGVGNTTTPQLAITKMSVSNVKDITCSHVSTFLLLNDGTVKACGSNNYSQLGNGNTTNQPSLITIPITNVRQVVCNGYATFFLLNDGTAKCCGQNDSGQLGLGHMITPISTLTALPFNVKQILGTNYTAYFVLNDNSVKACGYNQYGNIKPFSTNGYNVLNLTPIEGIITHTIPTHDIMTIIYQFLLKKLSSNMLYMYDDTSIEKLKSVTNTGLLDFTQSDGGVSIYNEALPILNENFNIFAKITK